MDPEELRTLAAPRPARSRDLHPFNGFYGHDAVLKAYAGLPERTVAKLAIEHGLDLTGVVSDLDRRLALPLALCFSDARAAELEAALPGVRAVAIGPPILYAAALAQPAPKPAARRVVLFPAHSAETVRARYDVVALLERTAAWRERFDETVVCLYWRDVLLGRAEEYRRAGIASTTAGHLLDPRFLFRLLDVLHGAAAVVTNEPGTHVAYAVALGAPVWIVPQEVDYDAGPGTALDQAEALAALGRDGGPRAALLRAFAEPAETPTGAQVELLARLAGVGTTRAPGDIAALFMEAEERYRTEIPATRRAVLRLGAAARRRLR